MPHSRTLECANLGEPSDLFAQNVTQMYHILTQRAGAAFSHSVTLYEQAWLMSRAAAGYNTHLLFTRVSDAVATGQLRERELVPSFALPRTPVRSSSRRGHLFHRMHPAQSCLGLPAPLNHALPPAAACPTLPHPLPYPTPPEGSRHWPLVLSSPRSPPCTLYPVWPHHPHT